MTADKPVDQTAEKTTADLQVIQSILPHRYPFLLVDKVVDMEPHKSAVGIKNVTFNEPHFQGHFPGKPIMPGVLVGMSMDIYDNRMLIYFMSVEKAKFRRMVVPGDVLKMHVTALRGGGKVWKFAGRAEVEGELACTAEFTAMMDLGSR